MFNDSSLIDSHCHFDLVIQKTKLAPEQLLQQAAEQKISKIIIPGLYPEQWHHIQKLSNTYSQLYFAVGIHPWWIAKTRSTQPIQLRELILELAQDSRCVAIGECGLDQHIDIDMKVQIEYLHFHIELANQTKKPLILHSRQTDHLILQQLKQHPLAHQGVMHAFTGHSQVAEAFLNQGLYLGAGGSITYPRARKTIESFCKIPLDRVLLETDAPDMPMKGRQGRINLPEYLTDVAECLSEQRQISMSNIQQQTAQNARRLFSNLL